MKEGCIYFGIILFCLHVACGVGSGDHSQPIAYNHLLHIEEFEMTCRECHTQVEDHEKAAIPNIEICRDCHEEALTQSKEEEKLVRYIERDEPIPWVQVHRIPDHTYFSHRRHVAMGGIECSECHGMVTTMTAPFTKAAVPLKMAFCIDCHEKNDITTDCAACHR